MKYVTVIFSTLVFLGSVYQDSALSVIDISGPQQDINSSDFPAWVDEWKAPKIVQKIFPFYLSGHDFEGSPVYVMEYGKWKVAEAIRTYKDGPEKGFELCRKYHDQIMYWIYRDGLANNGQGVAVIMDYDGFSISNYATPLGLKSVLRQLTWLDRLYKVLNYAFIINTNFAAENMIRLARPLMGNILDKCEIFGPQKHKWVPQLARKISNDQLAPWYGGPKDWQPVTIGLEPFNSTQAMTTIKA